MEHTTTICTICEEPGSWDMLGRVCPKCGDGVMVVPNHPDVRKESVYRQIAQRIQARANCAKRIELATEPDSNLELVREWFNLHTERIAELVDTYLPSGSGFDGETTIDLDKSTANYLQFETSFHHMNEGGMYDGWTDHTIRVRPSLVEGFTIQVSGRNRNDIKDYIGEVFYSALNEPQKVEG